MSKACIVLIGLYLYMKLASTNIRFWTFAKHVTLMTKTPGRLLIRGERRFLFA